MLTRGKAAPASPSPEVLALYQEGLEELYGGCFTSDCLSRLDSERILTMTDDPARAKNASIAVEEISVGQQTEGQFAAFTVQVVCEAESLPGVHAQITRSAQCLPEDGGKISFLRLMPSRELIAALS